ncbi:probable FK506-binding protein at C-terminar half [Coccomyxa sp. Obi]|nr:probable FK506-binding protein at C-terminar half [Coccomyxa sp. Obi]
MLQSRNPCVPSTSVCNGHDLLKHQPVVGGRKILQHRVRCNAVDSSSACDDTHSKRDAGLRRRQVLSLAVGTSALLASRAHAADLKAVVDGGVTVLVPTSAADNLGPAEKKALENNRRIQTQNNVPPDFPSFVRQGYDIKILADDYVVDDKGLIYKDIELGSGKQPVDGEEVTFDYVAYNENGARIDSSYNKGRPASTRLGINGLIPGFEMGIKSMQVGGKRRIVVSPELGPPVGPSTFFSAKQCEVFDVQLRAVRQCRRRQVAMFSDVVCE